MIKEIAFCASVVGEKSTTFLLICLFKKSILFFFGTQKINFKYKENDEIKWVKNI
jgi:hypothetical protein